MSRVCTPLEEGGSCLQFGSGETIIKPEGKFNTAYHIYENIL
jgi:hypothetical protein